MDSARNPYRHMLMSHMMADTPEELDAMATRIGVATRHCQGDHYDICQSKRREAIKAGAVVVTSRFLVGLRQQRRNS